MQSSPSVGVLNPNIPRCKTGIKGLNKLLIRHYSPKKLRGLGLVSCKLINSVKVKVFSEFRRVEVLIEVTDIRFHFLCSVKFTFNDSLFFSSCSRLLWTR